MANNASDRIPRMSDIVGHMGQVPRLLLQINRSMISTVHQ
jgi:hypothetical protein